MKTLNLNSILIALMITVHFAKAQDPNFSQFFSSPLNINPALTANINADWRLISNIRDQWIGPASPYITGTLSFDTKLIHNRMENVPEDNYMGIGGMLMFDHSMNGVVKCSYGSLNLSYSIKLTETDYYTERLGIGFGTTYCNRRIDFSRIDFEHQFTGVGFNRNLPTGESGMNNMKSYFSTNAGIVYTATTERTNFDLGVAAFHFNKPRQTFLKDENQFVPIRAVVHANFESIINDQVVFNTNGVYQFQKKAQYFSIGGALGYYLGSNEAETLVTGGVWYWSKNAIVPYIGISYQSFQVGFSYDFTISKLSQAERKPNTWELSMILRGDRKASGYIPCPWK
ncbi:MAG TPA: PorP/SprF family type IX secretion system membrane protein [Niastella sp.]